MASGSSAGGGRDDGCRQATTDCWDDDDDSEIRRSKRCRVASSSFGDDCYMDLGDGGGGNDETADDDGEDYMYEYDDSDGDGDGDEEVGEKAGKDDAASAYEKEQRYVVLTEDDIRARQQADTATVAEVLSIPAGIATTLLRHFKWRPGRVQEEWFSDGGRVRAAVGLPADGVPAPSARSPRRLVCAVCFDEFPAGRTSSAGCSHYYCHGCWRGYVGAAVGDGPPCLSLRCPEPSCSAAVVRELVDEVACAKDRARYAQFALRSYVEESGGRIKWCPGRRCDRAVKFVGCPGHDATDVFCACGHGFCWSCGEEAHRPVSCATVRAWLDKNASDSESANWVLANTKHCPKCRRPIEKNQGCNHMTCRAPCRHHFCWICLETLGRGRHTGCDGKLDAGVKAAVTKEEKTKRQAKASLDRYLHHYERWAANRASLEAVFRDMAALERSELAKMARAVDLPETDLGFVTEAYERIADGRRVLRWAHAYGYYLDPSRDRAKRELFDYLQNHANSWLERLHGCAELERKRLFFSKDEATVAVAGDTFRTYREKLVNLTRVTRRFLENLVKAFETDLPEVVKPAAARRAS